MRRFSGSLGLCRDRPVAICELEPHYRVTGLDNRLSPWVTIALRNGRQTREEGVVREGTRGRFARV